MRIGIDACGGGFIRFRDNMSRRIGRGGSGNCWVRCRGKNSSTIVWDTIGCWKKCMGKSIGGGWCNRHRLNRSGRIVRDDSSSC